MEQLGRERGGQERPNRSPPTPISCQGLLLTTSNWESEQGQEGQRTEPGVREADADRPTQMTPPFHEPAIGGPRDGAEVGVQGDSWPSELLTVCLSPHCVPRSHQKVSQWSHCHSFVMRPMR